MRKYIFLIFFMSYHLQVICQNDIEDNNLEYNNPKEYIIGGITASGIKYLNEKTLIDLSGLEIGKKINIPGDEISSAIKKLWSQGLFSNISIEIIKTIGSDVFLNIELEEHHRLSKFKFEGDVSKSDISSLKERLKLIRGKVLSRDLIRNSISNINMYYVEKGFLNAEISYVEEKDANAVNSSTLTFLIKKGKKVKIKEIRILGREKKINSKKTFFNKNDSIFTISTRKIKKSLKETKEKKWWRLFKVSKFISDNYEKDKENLIIEYNNKGYRDARIVSDTIYKNEDNTISIEIVLDEGNLYTFRNINWIGNTIHSSENLQRRLNINKGDVFNQSILEERLFGNGQGNDVSSIYLDDGYLFFNATPSEILVTEKNEIDLEIRIYEGKQARINSVNVIGNTKTNDHVIMREIRTRPGDLFKRSDIMRSQRELAQLQYFDPEQFDVKINPNAVKNNVDITYVVAEKSTDQINLQGGWGAGRVVGSLGFRFTNFSSRKIFKKNAWRPLPSGDGQTLSISASSNGIYYQNYNLSFTEPWLGAKKPNSLTISLFKSITSNGQTGDERQSVDISGLNIGLGKRLKYPDDYFTLYNGLSLQQYELNNSQGFFSFTDGSSNNISYNINLGRNSVDQLVFPRSGSNFLLSLKFTPPYSMFDNIDDYSSLTDQEKYDWLEYYKWKFKSSWYSAFTDKLVLNTRIEMGLLGSYNEELASPFERFYVGGDGLSGGYGMFYDGRELVSLRGYSNNSVSPQTGASVYSKYTSELRYALSLNPTSTVYVLGFLEAGNAWDNFDYFNPFSVKRSAGFGVRIMLPMIGMMGVDYGWGLDEIPGRPDANGGQFHFSIGQQF